MKYNFWFVVMKRLCDLTIDEKEFIDKHYVNNGREYFYKEATKRKVVPFVANTLSQLNLDKEFWQNIYDEYFERTNTIICILNNVFEEFKKNNITSPCLIENFAALLISNFPKGCFCSGDVDISADLKERDALRIVLERLGYKRMKRKKYRAEIFQDEYLYSELVCGKEFYINLVYEPVVRDRHYTLDQRLMKEWLKKERLQALSYKNTAIKIMSEEATFIHCVYHLSAGHYYCAAPGIRLLTELYSIIVGCNLKWDKIFELAKELKIEKRVSTSLKLIIEIFALKLDVENSKSLKESNTLNLMLINKKKKTLKEPKGVVCRLLIDVLSEDKNVIFAMFDKLSFILKAVTIYTAYIYIYIGINRKSSTFLGCLKNHCYIQTELLVCRVKCEFKTLTKGRAIYVG